MTEIFATIDWQRGDQPFTDNRYSRRHWWRFDGGAEVPASSSPHIVRQPMSDETVVDPEEAFVASLSSCHMLWFLSIAASGGYIIDHYCDNAIGVMGRDDESKLVVLEVRLKPKVAWSGDQQPTSSDIEQMHHRAHDECFIANSVKTRVVIEPVI